MKVPKDVAAAINLLEQYGSGDPEMGAWIYGPRAPFKKLPWGSWRWEGQVFVLYDALPKHHELEVYTREHCYWFAGADREIAVFYPGTWTWAGKR